VIQKILDLRFAFLAPVMGAGDEVDEEDEGEEEGDEGEEGAEGAGDKLDPRIKAANEEAKKHRLKAKELARKLREKEAAEREQADKDKPEIERLKTQVKRTEGVVSERDELKVRVAVLEMAIENGIKDVDFFEYKLGKTGLLKLDEEGDLPEELQDEVKKLVKKMAESEKDDGEERDAQEDEGAAKTPPPKSPRLSGKGKGKKEDSDLAALAKRYPALMQRQ